MPTIICNHRGFVIFLCGIVALWTICAKAALPPDPDNAALLYYQAFMLRPDADTPTYERLIEASLGADPDQQVRAHMKKCRDMIRLADAATRMPQCNWGIMYSQGDSLLTDTLGQLNQLAFLLQVDAHVLVADGDYRAALDRVLSVRRLAAHIAEETIVPYCLSLQLDYCLHTVQYILGQMPPDVDTLAWLQAQLSTIQGPPQTPGKALEMTVDQALCPASIEKWRERLTTPMNRDWLLAITADEVVNRARELGSTFVIAAQRIVGGDKPYAEKRAELQELADSFRANDDPATILLGLCYFGQVHEHYDIYVRHVALFNAVRAATETYIEIAKSGQFPQTLPAHLPRDPFSDEEFEYQTKDGGFVLRCKAKEIGEDRIWEYEFTVPARNEASG